MSERPKLNKEIDSISFRDFYYLKEELVEFCRANDLPVSGNKMELTERIASFLDKGEVVQVQYLYQGFLFRQSWEKFRRGNCMLEV